MKTTRLPEVPLWADGTPKLTEWINKAVAHYLALKSARATSPRFWRSNIAARRKLEAAGITGKWQDLAMVQVTDLYKLAANAEEVTC